MERQRTAEPTENPSKRHHKMEKRNGLPDVRLLNITRRCAKVNGHADLIEGQRCLGMFVGKRRRRCTYLE